MEDLRYNMDGMPALAFLMRLLHAREYTMPIINNLPHNSLACHIKQTSAL